MDRRPIKVLVACEIPDRAETALFQQLAARGVDLHIIRAPLKDGDVSGFEATGISETELVFRHRFDLKAVRVLKERFRQDRPDIVHCATNRALSCTLLASRGLSHRILAYRGTVGHIGFFDPTSWFAYLNPRVDRIWCVSHAVRDYLLSRRLPAERVVAIYKGQDAAWYKELPEPWTMQAFGIPDNAFTVAFVGNIRPVKGVDVLVRAMGLLPKSLNAHLLLVGNVRDTRVIRLVRKLGIADRVHFAGYRPEAAAILRRVDLAVTPSVAREGLGRSVMEAMAQAVPVLVTNVGGLPELVIDGVCGRVVPPRDPPGLAAAIRDLAADPDQRKALGLAARERIRTHFNIRTTVDQVYNLYGEMLALPPR